MVDVERTFFNSLQYERRLSDNTIIAYKTDLEQFKSFVRDTFDISNLKEVTHSVVRAWMVHLVEKKDAATTVNRKVSCLKSFYKFLIKNDEVAINPTAKIIRPKIPQRLPKDVKKSGVRDILDFIDIDVDMSDFKQHRDAMMFIILYTCGLRRSELIELKWPQIDFSQQQMRVLGKGKKERIIPLMNEVIDKLKTYKAMLDEQNLSGVEHHVFFLKNGKPLYPNYVYRKLKSMLSMVSQQKGLGPHTLRHSFATHLLDNGADLNVIKELLGHSSLAATQVYTHNSIEKLKEIHKFSHPKS